MVGRAVHGVRTLLARHPSPAAWGGYKKKRDFSRSPASSPTYSNKEKNMICETVTYSSHNEQQVFAPV